MHRKTLRAGVATLAIVAIAAPATATALAGGQAHSARSHTVVLKNIRFNPSALSINRGDSVTWVWRDGSTEHNVTGHGFRSRTQTRGSFTVRFTRAGTYSYRCTIHVAEGMTGKVVVH
jgi:plastocyanin